MESFWEFSENYGCEAGICVKMVVGCKWDGKEIGVMKIAVILASMDIEYVRETLEGIMEQADIERDDLYIFNIYGNSDETLMHNVGEYNLYSLVNYREFDGVILFANMIQGYSTYSKIIETIRQSGIPTVCIDTDVEGFCHVGTDGYTGMRNIVEHFIEHHQMTDFVYISGLDFNSDSVQRLQAFRDVLQEHNIPVDEKNIYKGAFLWDWGLEVGRELVKRDRQSYVPVMVSQWESEEPLRKRGLRFLSRWRCPVLTIRLKQGILCRYLQRHSMTNEPSEEKQRKKSICIFSIIS